MRTGEHKSIFLSYASEDAGAAQRIAEALRAGGLEVWFDKSELRGGDAWDASIRQQIRSCALLIPIISSNTQARGEGYFRREWKLAVDRMQDMAEDQAFLLPVVIDDTPDLSARVPDAFRARQWTRCLNGVPPNGFVQRVRDLVDGGAPPTASSSPNRPATRLAPARSLPWRRAFALGVAAVVTLGVVGWTANRYLRSTAVVPYSVEDRRMTFAVLPLRPPPGDTTGARVAASLAEAAQASQEKRKLWARVASPRSVEAVLARHAALKDIAAALNVHFLISGSLAAAKDGYEAEFLVVDGETERVLRTQKIAVAKGAFVPAREAVDDAMGWLTYGGLTAEVERARSRPIESLDVRDLAFRAYVEWNSKKNEHDEKGAYMSASSLLQRALRLDPDDMLALFLTARVNLCDCVNAWSDNVAEQQKIGEAALEKYLEKDPSSLTMQLLKSDLHALRGRHEESLLLLERFIREHPEAASRPNVAYLKAYNLLKLERPKDAWAVLESTIDTDRDWQMLSLASATSYALGRYSEAGQMAQEAKAQMDRKDLSNRRAGTVTLTLAAAEARLGRISRAKQALADFNSNVPGVDTITAIRKWMHPMADLAGHEPLFEGLRLAGVRE